MHLTRENLENLDYSHRNRWLYSGSGTGMRFLNVYRPYICPIAPILRVVPGKSRILDIGCGSGMMLANLAIEGKVAEGLGVDISENPIGAARQAAEYLQSLEFNSKLRFEVRHPDEILQHDQRFDVILMIDVMHHVPSAAQEGFLNGALSLLSSGGLFIYKDMCRRPLWKSIGNRLHDLALARQWIHYYPIDAVVQNAQEKDFSLIHREAYSQLWYGHELAVFKAPGPACQTTFRAKRSEA